jgi:integron integrase
MNLDAKPRLLDSVRRRLRLKHYSYRTEQQYVLWIRRFVLFHDKRHPESMGPAEVEAFLNDLAVHQKVSAATQNQALAAILFLYRQVLDRDLPWLDHLIRAKRPQRLPVVLSIQETRAVLSQLDGVYWLIGNLLYGSGLRLMECLQLRVQALDFEYQQILVRNGKGGKDRVTVLPRMLIAPLQSHLAVVRARHELALRDGYAGVELPDALARKFQNAALELPWQYVFPATRPSMDPRSGTYRRHHIHEDSMALHARLTPGSQRRFQPCGRLTFAARRPGCDGYAVFPASARTISFSSHTPLITPSSASSTGWPLD